MSLNSSGNEDGRLAALKSYNILDTGEEQDFDDLTTLASAICQTPIALISLIDDKRQWFKSRVGIAATETPIEYSFCTHTMATDQDIMIVEDATKDERFLENPFVTGNDKLTFYAGVPLVNDDGYVLGSLCVIDRQQKKLSDDQINALKIIAKQVVDKLELRKKAIVSEETIRELRDSNLFMQKFTAMAAHDIKNPMSSILLSAQSLKMRLHKLNDESCERLIDLNITSTKRLVTLIDDMLEYSKSPSLLLTKKSTVDLSELLRIVISMVAVPDNFIIQIPTEKHSLYVSSVAVQQVFINLLTNAIRYNDKEQGLIQIRFRESAENYYFEVEDNGIGIAEAYHEKIFANSFTLKITDRDNKKGSGIGLSTVKELIKALNGTITVQSTVGKGSTFYIAISK
jgi:signal transduction histidine kinase